MTQYKIVSGYGYVGDGKVYDEHPKFGHYKTGLLTYVCLVTGEHQSKYYALSNLQAVEQPAIQGCALPPAHIAAVQLEADIHETAMAFIFGADKAQTKRMSARKVYTLDLYARINQAVKDSLVVTLTPDLAANVNHAIGVSIQVVEASKAPVSVFHESMKAAA